MSEVTPIDATLEALAEPTRRRVVEMLRDGPRRAGDIAEHVGLSAPATSRHLRVLRTRGLIEEHHGDPSGDARVRLYQLRREPFDELEAWLEEVRSFWVDQLAAFSEHVDRGRRSAPKRKRKAGRR